LKIYPMIGSARFAVQKKISSPLKNRAYSTIHQCRSHYRFERIEPIEDLDAEA
jgi:hypothetical protein